MLVDAREMRPPVVGQTKKNERALVSSPGIGKEFLKNLHERAPARHPLKEPLDLRSEGTSLALK